MKTPVILLFAFICLTFLHTQTSAQGGWRSWEIHFLDGSQVEGNPLQMRKDGRFTRSMDPKEPGFTRSKIDYLAASTRELPPAPMGSFKQDLIVMLDGSRTFGAVTFRELKFSEGKIVQKGKETSLKNVAYIKFAHPKRRNSRK